MRHISIKVYIFFLSIIFPVCAYSQISLGTFGGYSTSKFIGDPPPKGLYAWGGGYIFGIRADIPLSKYIDLTTQPGFIQHKGKYMVYAGNGDKFDSLDIKMNSVCLPLGLTITANKERFFIYGGFELLKAYSFKAYNSSREIDMIDDIRGYFISLQFSAGYRIPIGRFILYFEIAYVQGLMNISENISDSDSFLSRVKLRDIRFLTGLQIPLTKVDKND